MPSLIEKGYSFVIVSFFPFCLGAHIPPPPPPPPPPKKKKKRKKEKEKGTPDRRLSLMNSCSFHKRWYSIIRKAYLFYARTSF